jgi:GGDEF domain-containing protein
MAKIKQLANAIEVSNGRNEWFEILVPQSWQAALILISLALIVMGLIWRKRKIAHAVTNGFLGNWHEAIPRYRRSINRLAAELERARRYRHSLTVTVMSVDHEQHKSNGSLVNLSGNGEMASHFFFPLISSLLRDNVRGCDVVTYDVTNDCYVFLFPESSAATAEQTMARLKRLVFHRAKIMLRFGIAEYPADGLILQDLVSRAHARIQRTACSPREIKSSTVVDRQADNLSHGVNPVR